MIIKLYKEGKTLKEIKEITGLSKHHVEKEIYQVHGLSKRRKRSEPHPKAEKVLHLSRWGYKPEEIAEGENIPLRSVLIILRNGN